MLAVCIRERGHIHRHSAPQPSSRPPQPSFRRKPESMLAGCISACWSYAPSFRPPNRHSGASRNLCLPAALGRAVTFTVIPPLPNHHSGPPTVIPAPQPSSRRKPESTSHYRQPVARLICPQPSFRRKPESTLAGCIRACGHIHRHSGPPQPSFRPPPNRHSGASRNLCLPAPLGPVVTFTIIPALPNHHSSPPTVIPACAGIYACRLH